MTTTLLSLEQLFSEAIGDYLSFDTTTNIAANTSIISTTLLSYDQAQNDYFNEWWVYITEGNNAGVLRKIQDYATTTGTITVYGANLAAEAGAVTCRLHRYNRANKVRALNRAIEQLYPALYRKLEDRTLITGNILPDSSFEWWTTSSAHKFATTSNVTLAKTTTAGLYRGARGQTSLKATASAANGYAYYTSTTYPRLLDLMDKTVYFYCWVYPEVANDAAIVIYTQQADGTAQTLTSTTTCPAGKWTKLELENQDLNEDLVLVEVRFKVITNTKYAYFDDAMLVGTDHLVEYLVPENFQDTGHVSQVHIQTHGYSDEAAYDIHPEFYEKAEFHTVEDDTYKYIRLYDQWESFNRIRLIGFTPLETLSADTDTITLEGERLNLIVAQAAINLYQMERGAVASSGKTAFNEEINYWNAIVRKLIPTMTMTRPSDYLRTR